MIWLVWRQFRTQAAVLFGVLVAVGIVLAVTGTHLVHLYDTTVANCQKANDCSNAQALFLKNDGLLQQLSAVVLVAPALIGIFWGAPLVAREFETGSYKLGWTQSITRTRWLAAKIALVGLASIVAAGLLSLMVTWWSSPFDTVNMNPFSPSMFDRRDLVPIGYAAFAFALGLTASVLIRRTLPAMAATLVAFVGVRMAFVEWVRPHLMTPLRIITPLNLSAGNGPPSQSGFNPANWMLSGGDPEPGGARHRAKTVALDPTAQSGSTGSPMGTWTWSEWANVPSRPHPWQGAASGSRVGPPSAGFNHAAQECAQKLGLKELVTYQPPQPLLALPDLRDSDLHRYGRWCSSESVSGCCVAAVAEAVWAPSPGLHDGEGVRPVAQPGPWCRRQTLEPGGGPGFSAG